MSRIPRKNTIPEIKVRKLIHSLGYRFRLHDKNLPGKPDIILPKHHKIIFVHGCFWHGHPNCKKSKRPSTNRVFWNNKLDKNIARDNKIIKDLKYEGWKPFIVWECETKNQIALEKKLDDFLRD